VVSEICMRTDGQTDRQTDKQNGMTIRLTLCERDAIGTLITIFHTLPLAEYQCKTEATCGLAV